MTTLLTMKGFNKKIDYLCFTANTANSKVTLNKTGSPTAVSLETSTNGSTWTSYTIGNAITLSNIGDKLYFRNTSDITTNFSTSSSNCYRFVFSGSINADGDVTSLINKNCTDTLSNEYCFGNLFSNSSSNNVLKTAPQILATTLTNQCYRNMFRFCSGLTTLPKLPATTLTDNCYQQMFHNCSSIKLSETQTGEYQTEYRIPITGTGTTGSNSLINMFTYSGGTFTGTPTINTTYYTSNQVI